MGFNFSFFGEPSHRQFNYKPRYYDVEEEERRKFFGDHSAKAVPTDDASPADASPADASSADAAVSTDAAVPTDDAASKPAEPHKPGRYIYGSFRDGNYQKEKTETTKVKKIIGMVALILAFVVLYYFAKFYMLILK